MHITMIEKKNGLEKTRILKIINYLIGCTQILYMKYFSKYFGIISHNQLLTLLVLRKKINKLINSLIYFFSNYKNAGFVFSFSYFFINMRHW